MAALLSALLTTIDIVCDPTGVPCRRFRLYELRPRVRHFDPNFATACNRTRPLDGSIEQRMERPIWE